MWISNKLFEPQILFYVTIVLCFDVKLFYGKRFQWIVNFNIKTYLKKKICRFTNLKSFQTQKKIYIYIYALAMKYKTNTLFLNLLLPVFILLKIPENYWVFLIIFEKKNQHTNGNFYFVFINLDALIITHLCIIYTL